MIELALNGGHVIVLVGGLALLHNIGDPTISTKSSLSTVPSKRHHAVKEARTSEELSVRPSSPILTEVPQQSSSNNHKEEP